MWPIVCVTENIRGSSYDLNILITYSKYNPNYDNPFSNVNDRIMPMSDAVLSEGPTTMSIQQRSSALYLTHRDFSESESECALLPGIFTHTRNLFS